MLDVDVLVVVLFVAFVVDGISVLAAAEVSKLNKGFVITQSVKTWIFEVYHSSYCLKPSLSSSSRLEPKPTTTTMTT